MSSRSVTPIRRVLVANRGEIAVRVMRTCKERGIETVAVYSDVDRNMPHVMMADRAIGIGPAPARESYLVIDKILDACRRSGADGAMIEIDTLNDSASKPKAQGLMPGGILRCSFQS